MCGISGWIDTSNKLLDTEDIKNAMLKTMRHRGPDDEGEYLEENVLLLHTRLSVMDPKHGKQPMHFKQYVIVYNGEIYNTKEIKEALSKEGYIFKSNCDTEVLIKAYDFYKEECVHKLNGIFAFVVWDKENKTAFMARDRLGVKPFFYYQKEHKFLFASEIKTLLAHPDVDAIVKEDGLKELFLLGPARTRGKTPIENIYELEQGECATFKDGKLNKKVYWKPISKKHSESLEESISHVRKLVEESIKMQLDSDVGLCTFLSGGLDSSIITKIASKRYSHLDTYSIEYEENDKYFKRSVFQPNRDADFIDVMVKDSHTNHHSIVVGQEDVIHALKDSTRSRDLPGMAEVDSSLLLFCKEIKKDYSVAISGEGADEIFGGYPWYYNEEVLWKDCFPWSSSIETRMFCLKDNLFHDPEAYVKKAYEESICDIEYIEGEDNKQKRMREMFYLNLRWFLQTLLDRKDRMSMYSGLEVRVPFLDYRLVEYAYNLPWEYKSLYGREKGILREAFKDVLPEAIVERKKSPYPKSHHPKYSEMLIQEIRTILKKECVLSQILDAKKVETFIADMDHIETLWYGQLMRGPQVLAYLVQMHTFFEEYGIKLEI